MMTLNVASTNLYTEGSLISAREEEEEAMVVSAGNCGISVPERLTDLEAKHKRTVKSYTPASEVKPSKQEWKEVKHHSCNSFRTVVASQIKGVKRKSLNSPKEESSETRHHTSNARKEEVQGIGRRLSDDSMRRNDESVDRYSSRSEKRLKLKSSITSRTELYECGGRGNKEDRKRIDCSSTARKVETEMIDGRKSRSPKKDTRGKVVPGFNDEIKQKSETQDRWRGSQHHAYLGPSDFYRSRMAQSRSERDSEHRTNWHLPSEDCLEEDCFRIIRRRRADFQHSTVTARNGGNYPTSPKDGTFERDDLKRGRGNIWRSMEDLKARRDVPKRSGEEGGSVKDREVKQSARDNRKALFDDHVVTGGDAQLPRDTMDRFKPEELEEENLEGQCEIDVIGEEDGMRGNRRRHSKDLRQKCDSETGNDASQHGKNDVTKLKACRHSQSHRLPTNFDKPRSHREEGFKGSTEHQGHSIAINQKQNTRVNVYGSHERHWNDDQNDKRDGQRSGRTLKLGNNSPSHQRRPVKDDTMDGFAGQPGETDNGPDLVRKNHDYAKSVDDSVDFNSSRRHQIRVDNDGAEEEFVEQPREIENGPDLVRKSHDDQKSGEDVHQNSSWRHERIINKDSANEGFAGQLRETGPDVVMKNPDEQNCGNEIIEHSSSGMKGPHRPGSKDTKVVRHELASETSKGEGNSKRRCSSKLIALSHLGKQDVEGMTDQNGGNRENACIGGKLPKSCTEENCKMDSRHKLQGSEPAESNLQEERGGTTESPRQLDKEVDPGTKMARQDTLHHSTSNPLISEKRKRKNRAEIAKGLEKPKAVSCHSREERPEIQERQESKSLIENNSKDDGRSKGTPKRSFCAAIVVEEKMRTGSRAARKSEEALQFKRARILRKEEKSNGPFSRQQVVSVGRYKHDVSSQEHDHRKGRGKSHSMSPNKHKRLFSPKAHGKAKSPGRSERDRSSWERFDRERHKSLAAVDSRYRRFGGGTSGLGGYSPRRRRSEAAVKTPSPPPRSPARKKEKAWDSVPPGMDSSMIAAITAAHQSAVQQALTQLVNPLVTNNMLISSSGTPSIATRLPTVPSIHPSHQFHLNPAVTAVTLTQATRPLRRLYVGNVPSTVSDGELMEFMNAAMLSANANHLPGTKPCINCSVNVDKNHAFAEFITPEDATAALAFDGVTLHGTTLKIRRPKDFVQPSNGGVESVSAVPDMVLSIVADSPHKVFVGGIPPSITSDKVKEIVTAFGQLKAFHWEVDSKKQFPEAFAFLEYMDPSATLTACSGLNGMRLGNGILTVVQATPDAHPQTATMRAPFYGIPDHAKTLLEPPSRVLEFRNLVTTEAVPNLSEVEIEEIIEDVRLECTRFGNVKSTHSVYRQSLPKHETRKMPSCGKIKGIVAKINQGENLVCTTVPESAKEDITEEDIVEKYDNVQKTFSGFARSQFGTSFDVDDKRMPATNTTEGLFSDRLREGNEKSNRENFCHTNEHSRADTRIANPTHLFEDRRNEFQATRKTSQLEKTVATYGHQLAHMQNQNIGGGLLLMNGSEQKLDFSSREWETSRLGRVYVEFSTEESACQAAHSLHGRLFNGHKVVVHYFPFQLYQKAFHKGLGARTLQEKQEPALGVQEHLTAYTKD